MKYLLILIIIMLATSKIFSFCEHSQKKECLKFEASIKLKGLNNAKVMDLVVDKNKNKYLLLNTKTKEKNIFFIIKLDRDGELLWSRYIKGVAWDILINDKSEVIISSEFIGDIKLENSKYNFKTKSLLLIKLNSDTGKLKKHLFVSTNYGVAPIIAKLDAQNNIYIAGYYGGNSDIIDKSDKVAYEDGFLLVLDENFNKKWSKSFIERGFAYVSDLKIGKNKIYLTIKKNNNGANTLKIIDIKTMKEELVNIKDKVISFDIDDNENIYLINSKYILKKFDKNFKKIVEKKLNSFEFSATPIEVIVKNNSLFIQYIVTVDYTKSMFISNYSLDIKSNWNFAILGQSYIKNKLKLINNNLFLFGEYQGNLTFLDKDFFSLKIIPFILVFSKL